MAGLVEAEAQWLGQQQAHELAEAAPADDPGAAAVRTVGELLASNGLTPTQLDQLGIATRAGVEGLDDRHRTYLDHDRREVLVRM